MSDMLVLGIDIGLVVCEDAAATAAVPFCIGVGSCSKYISSELSTVGKISSSSNKFCDVISYACIGITTIEGIVDNYNSSATLEKIVWDAAIDVSIDFAIVCISSSFGAAVVAATSFTPGTNILIGAVAAMGANTMLSPGAESLKSILKGMV